MLNDQLNLQMTVQHSQHSLLSNRSWLSLVPSSLTNQLHTEETGGVHNILSCSSGKCYEQKKKAASVVSKLCDYNLD